MHKYTSYKHIFLKIYTVMLFSTYIIQIPMAGQKKTSRASRLQLEFEQQNGWGF